MFMIQTANLLQYVYELVFPSWDFKAGKRNGLEGFDANQSLFPLLRVKSLEMAFRSIITLLQTDSE